MPRYDTIVWLPNALVLTAVFAVGTWFVWRARGVREGIRMVGVTMLPLALYFTGLLRLIWMMLIQVSSWASGFVLHPSTWLGVAMFVVAAILIFGANRLGRKVDPASSKRVKASGSRASAKSSKQAGDQDIDEIEALLKKHGID